MDEVFSQEDAESSNIGIWREMDIFICILMGQDGGMLYMFCYEAYPDCFPGDNPLKAS